MWLALLTGVALAGPSAFEAGDCNLCHQVPDVPHASQIESCTTCHQWIKEVSGQPAKRAVAMEAFPLWERYEKNVASYMEVPSLEAAMARLEPEWVRSYLVDPHALRPGLPETMPRFGLDAAAVSEIVASFEAAQKPVPAVAPPSAERVEQGRALFAVKGCVACHSFGGTAAQPGVPMAPDLAHTRKRMSNDRIVAWIRDPKSISAKATMPSLGLTEDVRAPMHHQLGLAFQDHLVADAAPGVEDHPLLVLLDFLHRHPGLDGVAGLDRGLEAQFLAQVDTTRPRQAGAEDRRDEAG